ncbi:hypothetical protein llap_13592 [Limosa lapponica baueri]|uniref:Uncharacterized protein n=1 Tax=Limosa lapponica baueri TaxID=1758121 RepID=A0A2I0TQN8_LIMLA|nr:hypothetical protein llap_13592 [Limosa lapponica baueri]
MAAVILGDPVQDPDIMDKDKQQDSNLVLQESRLWPVQGYAWKNPMGYNPGEKRGPGQLVDFQGSSPSSRVVHPDVKQEWQEAAWMNEKVLKNSNIKTNMKG